MNSAAWAGLTAIGAVCIAIACLVVMALVSSAPDDEPDPSDGKEQEHEPKDR